MILLSFQIPLWKKSEKANSSNLSDKANSPQETAQVPTLSTVLLPVVPKGKALLHPCSRPPPPILRSSIPILADQALPNLSISHEIMVNQVSTALGQHIPEDYNSQDDDDSDDSNEDMSDDEGLDDLITLDQL